MITVVGVGALGSHLVQFLRNEDVAIRIIDFDRVEQKNVMSQFHSKPSVRKLKVSALKQSMQFLYGREIMAVNCRLAEDNIDTTIFGDLVIDCLDNGATRRLIQKRVREEGIPCLHGGLDGVGSFGRVVWDKQFVIDDEAGQDEATCENGEFLPFIAITAAYLARAAQMFLADGKRIGFLITPGDVVSSNQD